MTGIWDKVEKPFDLAQILEETPELFLPFWIVEPQAREFMFLLELYRQRLSNSLDGEYSLLENSWPVSQRLHQQIYQKVENVEAATDDSFHQSVAEQDKNVPAQEEVVGVDDVESDEQLQTSRSIWDFDFINHDVFSKNIIPFIATLLLIITFSIGLYYYYLGVILPNRQAVIVTPTLTSVPAVSSQTILTATTTFTVTPTEQVEPEASFDLTETPELIMETTPVPTPETLPIVNPTPPTPNVIGGVIREFSSGQLDRRFFRTPDLGIPQRGFYNFEGIWYFTSYEAQEIINAPVPVNVAKANFMEALNPRELERVGALNVLGHVNRGTLSDRGFGVYIKNKDNETFALLLTQHSDTQFTIGVQTFPDHLIIEDNSSFLNSLQPCLEDPGLGFDNIRDYHFQLYVQLTDSDVAFFVSGQDIRADVEWTQQLFLCEFIVGVGSIEEIGLISIGDNVDIRFETVAILQR